MTTKHKHYDLIVAWAGGATIQLLSKDNPGEWIDLMYAPSWYTHQVYRVKPKPPVKKYFWIIKAKWGYGVSSIRYSEEEVKDTAAGFIQKIEDSMIEVEE